MSIEPMQMIAGEPCIPRSVGWWLTKEQCELIERTMYDEIRKNGNLKSLPADIWQDYECRLMTTAPVS